MIDPVLVEQQLKDIGIVRMPLCRPELNQLPRILVPGEIIEHLLGGIYIGGYAIIVTTSHRLLVIDKVVGGVVIEDIPYDMIAEVKFVHTLFTTKVVVHARAKRIEFKAFKNQHVRSFTEYLQQRVMEARQQMRVKQTPFDDPASGMYRPSYSIN